MTTDAISAGAAGSTRRAGDPSLPWVLAAGTVLAAGVAAYLLSPTLGVVALALPLAPLLVLAPEYGLLALFATVPFDTVAALSDSGTLTVTRLLGLAVLGGWLVHLLANRQRVRLATAGKLLAAYVGFAAVSVAWAADVSVAGAAVQTLVQLLLLYVMASNVLTTPRQMLRALDVLLVSTTVLAVLVLLQLPGTDARATFTHGAQSTNPNYLAASLVFPAVAALALGRGRGPLGWWRVGALVPIVLALFATGSRGGGVALAGGLVVIALVRPGLGLRAALAATVAVLLLPAVLPRQSVDEIWSRYAHAQEDRLSGRFDIWRVGLAMAADRPLSGTAVGGFRAAFYRYMLETRVDPYFALAHSFGNRAAHNVYLGTLAELGVVGAGLLVGALVAHGRAARRALQRAAGGRGVEARVGVALLAVFGALVLFGGSIDLLTMKMPWMLLALMHATALPGAGRAP